MEEDTGNPSNTTGTAASLSISAVKDSNEIVPLLADNAELPDTPSRSESGRIGNLQKKPPSPSKSQRQRDGAPSPTHRARNDIVPGQQGLVVRRSQKQSRDDSELGEAAMLDGDIVIKLHSKIIKARSLLMDINISLANSTTDVILKHKPVFDEEKRRLIKFQSSIDKIYKEGLTVQFIHQLTPIDCALCEATEFGDWNALAKEINRLTRRLKDLVHLNNMVESTMSVGSSSGAGGGVGSSGALGHDYGSASGVGGLWSFFAERYDSNGVPIGKFHVETPFGSIRLTSMQLKMVGLVTLLVVALGSMVMFWPSSTPAPATTAAGSAGRYLRWRQ